MPITEFKQVARLSTNDQFWNDVAKPAEFVALKDRLIASGDWVSTTTLSEDELVQTRIDVYQNLEVLSEVFTATNIELKGLFRAHTNLTKQVIETAASRILSGIDAPFTVTATFTFPADATALVEKLAYSFLYVRHTSTQVATATSLVVTSTYADSAEYTLFEDSEPPFVTDHAAELIAAGCVRTITFAMI